MNVLISCAGRRNDLVSYFRAVPGVDEVHCCDMDIHAPSWEQADHGHVTPGFRDPAYVPRLLQICRDYRIDLMVTINDFELPILARLKAELAAAGTTAVVSDPEVIDICLDKRRTTRFLVDHGFHVPVSYNEHGPVPPEAFPVIVKPRFGTGSIGVQVAANGTEYAVVLAYARLQVARSAIVQHFEAGNELLVEQQVSGAEYAVDVVNDLAGNFAGAVVKRKLAKRHGDAALVVTENVPRLQAWAHQLSQCLKHVGNLDCDVFMTNDRIYCVDLNPRFGGAYPFSHLAGVNVPALLVHWVSGDNKPASLDYEPGIVVVRTEAYLRLEKFRTNRRDA